MYEVICEECDTPMHQFSFLDISGWACSGCGWSYDDEEFPDDEPTDRAESPDASHGTAVPGVLATVLRSEGPGLGQEVPGRVRRSAWSPDGGPPIYSHTLTSKNGRSVTGHGFTQNGAEEDALERWMRGEG